jgi:hypothetical protein
MPRWQGKGDMWWLSTDAQEVIEDAGGEELVDDAVNCEGRESAAVAPITTECREAGQEGWR